MNDVTRRTIYRLASEPGQQVYAVKYHCNNCGVTQRHRFPVDTAAPDIATCKECHCPAEKKG